MKSLIKAILFLVVTSLASYSLAHSGRTDSFGGHNCSAKSKQKGLCSGYHYHNNSSIDQFRQIEIEVSAASEKDRKADKRHSQYQQLQGSQEG